MGFRKENAVTTITIPMRFQHINQDVGTTEDVDVAHVFRPPTTKQRERYNSEAVKIKRRRVNTSVSAANWNLFRATILHVEGYDDLPANPEEQTLAILTEYFVGDVVRIHVDESVSRLMESISAEDIDWEKK